MTTGEGSGSEGFEHLEAVSFGNLNVEEEKVGLLPPDGLHGLVAVAALAHDLDVRLDFEKGADPLASQGFVVHDDGPDLRHGPLIETRRPENRPVQRLHTNGRGLRFPESPWALPIPFPLRRS